jgi:hypothetical protein
MIFVWRLRADEGNEEHESDNLHEALGGLGEAEEFHDDGVPEELADEGEDNEGDDEGQDDGEAIGVDFLLLGGGGICETFHGHAGNGSNRGVHFSIMSWENI